MAIGLESSRSTPSSANLHGQKGIGTYQAPEAATLVNAGSKKAFQGFAKLFNSTCFKGTAGVLLFGAGCAGATILFGPIGLAVYIGIVAVLAAIVDIDTNDSDRYERQMAPGLRPPFTSTPVQHHNTATQHQQIIKNFHAAMWSQNIIDASMTLGQKNRHVQRTRKYVPSSRVPIDRR